MILPHSATLQSFVWPRNDEPARKPLYCRGDSSVSENGTELRIAAGSRVSFATAINALSLKAWRTYTSASNFRLSMVCSGNCQLTLNVWKTPENEPGPSIPWNSHTYILGGESPRRYEFPVSASEDADWASIAVEALEDCTLIEASWHADTPGPPKPVYLAMVICSCRRETIIRQNVADLKASLPAGAPVEIMVVDNGGTLRPEDFGPDVKLILNPNTGGAGGFTRGLIEALQARQVRQSDWAGDVPLEHGGMSRFTHVVFSDDDAFVPACAIPRTLTLLSLVNAEYADARISGVMMIAETPTVQHTAMEWRKKDSGGFFPRIHSADLGIWENVLRHAVYFDAPAETDTYGAWWYGVIKLSPGISDDLPLPLFFRLDDIEYGLRFSRRGGKWMMLNGICCFHPGFEGKQPTPMRRYYAVRNRYICQAVNEYNYPIGLPWSVLGKLFLTDSYALALQNKKALRDFITGPSVLMQRPDPEQFVNMPDSPPGLFRHALLSLHVYLLRIYIRWKKAALTKRWREQLPYLTSLAFWKRYLNIKD